MFEIVALRVTATPTTAEEVDGDVSPAVKSGRGWLTVIVLETGKPLSEEPVRFNVYVPFGKAEVLIVALPETVWSDSADVQPPTPQPFTVISKFPVKPFEVMVLVTDPLATVVPPEFCRFQLIAATGIGTIL